MAAQSKQSALINAFYILQNSSKSAASNSEPKNIKFKYGEYFSPDPNFFLSQSVFSEFSVEDEDDLKEIILNDLQNNNLKSVFEEFEVQV